MTPLYRAVWSIRAVVVYWLERALMVPVNRIERGSYPRLLSWTARHWMRLPGTLQEQLTASLIAWWRHPWHRAASGAMASLFLLLPGSLCLGLHQMLFGLAHDLSEPPTPWTLGLLLIGLGTFVFGCSALGLLGLRALWPEPLERWQEHNPHFASLGGTHLSRLERGLWLAISSPELAAARAQGHGERLRTALPNPEASPQPRRPRL